MELPPEESQRSYPIPEEVVAAGMKAEVDFPAVLDKVNYRDSSQVKNVCDFLAYAHQADKILDNTKSETLVMAAEVVGWLCDISKTGNDFRDGVEALVDFIKTSGSHEFFARRVGAFHHSIKTLLIDAPHKERDGRLTHLSRQLKEFPPGKEARGEM